MRNVKASFVKGRYAEHVRKPPANKAGLARVLADRVVAFRLTKAELDAIDSHVRPGGFRSRTHFLTDAIREYLWANLTSQKMMETVTRSRQGISPKRSYRGSPAGATDVRGQST